ncbi:MAG TPA: GspE/PulE family protein [Pirellulaceae bacterium]|jgi:type IV pilus assembly protein PilB|nr:GspE/PulE family protein [Pirellulaceae bacterium]
MIQGFAQLLLKNKIISNDQLKEAEAFSQKQKVDVPEALVKLNYASAEDVTKAVAKAARVEYVDLSARQIPADVIEYVPQSVARENHAVPISIDEDGSLRVAVANPDDVETLEKLRFILNKQVRIAVASKGAILEAINRYYGQIEGESADTMLQEFTDTEIDFTQTDNDEDRKGGGGDDSNAPIVRLVQVMITEAIQLRASDIHVEPFEDRVRIRYRIDGVLQERDKVPRRMLGALISRIKIIGSMDIAERRRPQDGRIKVTAGEKELDLRVSVIPTNHGQSVVMRLLDKDNIKISVRQLGFGEETFAQFQGLIKRPNGILLVTGPTGSGKTTTLYAAMNALNRPDRKIITAEDPVEYYLPGINQVQVNHDIGLDFSRIIRAMLRQAPNVILVGEMRDYETASMGIQASLTGHLVFSTLHTNDAPSAVTRLSDMKVPEYLVASTVIGILAQRLVRVVCPKCKQKYVPSDAELAEAGISKELAKNSTFARGKGCGYCNRKGYRGRLGIYELMTINSKVRQAIFDRASSVDLRRLAINNGMRTLYMDGMHKVMNGITTFDEVYRTAKRTEQDVIS